MKITVLAENTSNRLSLASEHGLSLLIETDRHTVLFDMGQSDLFYQNAKKLNIDLSKVDLAILSHGHYDHGGGMQTFFAVNSTALVSVHPKAFGAYYNGTSKYIGLPADLKNHPRIVLTEDWNRLDEGITLFSGNAHIPSDRIDASGLTVFADGEYTPDRFLHEQYLLIEEHGKKILFTGCAHKGICNLVEWVQPDMVIGGFHFKSIVLDDAGRSRLSLAAEKLSATDVTYYTCHCTGVEQYRYLKDRMKRLHYLSVGDCITI